MAQAAQAVSSQIDPADVVVLVLGGGRGTRLHPLTRDRVKPAIAFGGKYRLIDICLTNCLRSQLEQIFILTQFDSFTLSRHIWQAYGGEVQGRGFVDAIATHLGHPHDDLIQGTAEAIRGALKHVLRHNPRYVMILSGDQIYSLDYRKLLGWHATQSVDVTIGGQFVAEETIRDRTLLRVGSKYRALEMYERPRRADKILSFKLDEETLKAVPPERPYLASMGVWVFNTSVLQHMLEGDDTDFVREVLPAAVTTRNVSVYPFDGYWEDVGTIQAFYQANMEWRQGGGIAEMFQQGSSILTHSRHLPPSRINGSLIEDSIIADGADVQANRVSRSIIGIRAHIGEEAIIEDSIIMGNSDSGQESSDWPSIGADTVVRRAIIDKDVTIGANCRIVNNQNVENLDHDDYVIRSGIVVIPCGAIIPPNAVI